MEWGKGQRLISSIPMPELLPPSISKYCGLFTSCAAYGRHHCDWVCKSLGLHFKFGKEHAAINEWLQQVARQFCYVIWETNDLKYASTIWKKERGGGLERGLQGHPANHLEERLLDQAQADAIHPPFGGVVRVAYPKA